MKMQAITQGKTAENGKLRTSNVLCRNTEFQTNKKIKLQ